MKPAEAPTLDALADRTDRLLTLPPVAVEVLRLTDDPDTGATALCDCLESDPALAAKLLRVVNSSLYNLPREIASLREAIAIIGVQPLKLLVLGFALPDELLENIAGEALRRYWTRSLTTATAARALAEAGWGRLGDEALVAGLLQGLGQLVLLHHLGEDYADLTGAAATEPIEPVRSILPLESESMGFHHRELSAELIRRWKLPERLAEAIDRQDLDALDHLEGDEACLAQSLWLANRLTRLVVDRDLGALADLLDDGQRYCGLTKRQINAIVDKLQGRLEQLAEAMAIEVDGGYDYHQTLIEAHARLALVADHQAILAMGQPRSDDEIYEDERLARELLTETNRLAAAMRVFIAGGRGPRTDQAISDEPNHAASKKPHLSPSAARTASLSNRVEDLVAECRERREPLTIGLLQVSSDSPLADTDATSLRRWLDGSSWADELTGAVWEPLTRDRLAVLLPGVERHQANRLWNEVAAELARATPLCLDMGVAGVTQLSRGFSADRLIEPAQRCLDAARATAGPAIKSIEVF